VANIKLKVFKLVKNTKHMHFSSTGFSTEKMA